MMIFNLGPTAISGEREREMERDSCRLWDQAITTCSNKKIKSNITQAVECGAALARLTGA